MTRVRVARAVAAWTAAALWLAAAGCGSDAGEAAKPAGPPPMPGGPGMAPPNAQEVEAKLPGGDEFAAGKKVYAAQGCARCHKLGETGGSPAGPMGPPGGPAGMPPGMPPGGPKGKMGGPDLTTVGGSPEHTADWLAAHIRDPKAHKPESRMPAYGPEKISDADLKALVDYLASRK